MRVVGFTFIRNAISYDYPIVEAIQSIQPLCDEVVVAVGASNDDTLELIRGLEGNLTIIETVWDDDLREGGRVLAIETNKALDAVTADADWCIYIQGDEVLHEDGHAEIYNAMELYLEDFRIEGLLVKYRHFYGSYDYVGTSSKWYKNEIRIIRNGIGIRSYRDAQGFRKPNDLKLRVARLDAYMHHYGWVKHPEAMQLKQRSFHQMWHDDEWIDSHIISGREYDYARDVGQLARFEGSHPLPMRPRVRQQNWSFDTDISIDRRTWKDRFKEFCYQRLGLEIGYKNYLAVRD